MSSGKGGSSGSSLNYYGTLAGAICWGPLDWLTAVIANGNYVFQGSLTLTADVTDLTGSILDPDLIGPGGYLKLYRGTETQPADPALSGHPPYRGTALLVAKNIFFGQDSGTAPNLQVIAGRLPRVPTTIVAAADNISDDSQINPVAAWAEILLDERGGNVDPADFDTASWLVAAHWCAQDQAHKDFCFCSPLVVQQSALRQIAKELIDPFNGFCRRTKDGKLACVIYEWGTDPGGLPLLDARTWTQRPKIPLGDWVDIPTEIVVGFVDRSYDYQDNTIIIPNARAQQIRQVDDQGRLDRKHVTRIAQAHKHGTEYIRRIGLAPASGPIKVRQPFVDGLNPGDKLKIDTDPEPGGAGLAQLCRVKSIQQDRTDEATLTVLLDTLLPATPYTPGFTPPSPPAPSSPAMAHFLAIPLPPAAFGMPLAIGIIATRPDATVVGMEVYFSDLHTNPFDDLGKQTGFAARAQLYANITNAATTVELTELDTVSGPDAGLAADTPGGNNTAAQNDTLLILLAQLDGSGRVALDGSGDPIMEFISVVDRSAAGPADTFNYTVLRGRLDTPALAWTAGTVAWVIPRINLIPWRHQLMAGLAGSAAFMRLVSYTSLAGDTTIPVPECSVNMLPTTSPMYMRGGSPSGTSEMALLPDYVDAGTPHVAVHKPTGAGDAYNVSYSIAGGAWATAYSFPFTLPMATASQTFQLFASDTGKTPSGVDTESWNLLFL